jgi:hypothetical protein
VTQTGLEALSFFQAVGSVLSVKPVSVTFDTHVPDGMILGNPRPSCSARRFSASHLSPLESRYRAKIFDHTQVRVDDRKPSFYVAPIPRCLPITGATARRLAYDAEKELTTASRLHAQIQETG